MNVEEVLARARSQLGLGIRYRLGGGTSRADRHTCADAGGCCDCSAYVCWALGIDKNGPYPYLVPAGTAPDPSGEWYGTDNIWNDAVLIDAGLFQQVPRPAPGAVVVYPGHLARGRRRPGHVGLITTVGDGGAFDVIHCSSGNSRRFGDAIQETDNAVFAANSRSIVAWCASVELPLTAGVVRFGAALIKPVRLVVVAQAPDDEAIKAAALEVAGANPVGRQVVVSGDSEYPAPDQIAAWVSGHASPGAVILRASGELFRVLPVSQAKKRAVIDAAFALAASRV